MIIKQQVQSSLVKFVYCERYQRNPRVMSVKTCTYCGKPLMGRADKKFCDSDCRSSYYNELNRHTNNLMRQVNRTLSKNRRILKGLNPDGKATVHRSELLKKKF